MLLIPLVLIPDHFGAAEYPANFRSINCFRCPAMMLAAMPTATAENHQYGSRIRCQSVASHALSISAGARELAELGSLRTLTANAPESTRVNRLRLSRPASRSEKAICSCADPLERHCSAKAIRAIALAVANSRRLQTSAARGSRHL